MLLLLVWVANAFAEFPMDFPDQGTGGDSPDALGGVCCAMIVFFIIASAVGMWEAPRSDDL